MREQSACTVGEVSVPVEPGPLVSIYVDPDHVLAATPSAAELGGAAPGDGDALAAGGKKRGWATGVVVGCLVICAVDGVDVGQALSSPATGGVFERERGGSGVSVEGGRSAAVDSGSQQHRAGVCGAGGRGAGGGQPVDREGGRG